MHQIHLDGQVICDFERDALHREIKRSQGDLSSHYQLDPLGRLLASHTQSVRAATDSPSSSPNKSNSQNSSQGQNIARRYHYDAAGQLQSLEDSRHGRSSYEYDVLGRLTHALAGHANERFAFDPAHNLIEASSPTAQASAATSQSTTPNHPTQNPSNRPSSSDEQWAQYVKAHIAQPSFNPLQSPSSTPAAAPEHWSACAGNRLQVWQEHRYQYDAWGNCTEKKSGKHQEQHYVWDGEHQLIEVHTRHQDQKQGQAAHWQYAYDPFGRRIAKWQEQAPANAKASTSKAKAAAKPQSAQLTHFTWDGNRLLAEYCEQAQAGAKTSATAKAKVKQAPHTQHKLYLYEPESFVPLAQVNSEWAHKDKEAPLAGFLQAALQEAKNDPQIWANNVVPLQRKLQSSLKGIAPNSPNTPASGAIRSQTLYYHTDHLGTPRELTDKHANIVWTARYKAWGATERIEHPPILQTTQVGNTLQQQWAEQSEPEKPEQNLRFQGQYFDAETGLHYNRFRYYDPDCGRFVSQDPIGLAGGINAYQYAPNPTGWIDPLGLAKKGAAGTMRGPNLPTPNGTTTGKSTGAGGKGITNDIVQKIYDEVPVEKRSLFHCKCAEGEMLSNIANAGNVKNTEDLKKLTEGATSEVFAVKDGIYKPACASCAPVLDTLGINHVK